MTFPLFVELQNAPCLVVGGGRVAWRKALSLRAFGATVTLIAPEFDSACASADDCRLVRREFDDGDVLGQTLVVAATDKPEVNAQVAQAARTHGIPVNAVDDPENCTFFFPAIFRKGPFTAGVSTGGACPVAARLLRDRIARIVPDDLAEAVAELGAKRAEIRTEHPDVGERREFYERQLEKWKD